MNPDLPSLDWTSTVVWHDERKMPLSRDHWIRSIYGTLGDRSAWVSMDVSYDTEGLRITQVPQFREARGSNVNVADQAIGIKIVKVSGPYRYRYSLTCMGKQKDARFPSATKASTAQFLDRFLPQVEANLKAGLAGPKLLAPMQE